MLATLKGFPQKKSKNIASYAVLKRKVEETLLLGQERIEREKVRTYWETGKLINDYLEENRKEGKQRADYGRQVVLRLAEDLGIGGRLLYHCIRFAQKIKNLSSWTNSFSNRLNWSHFRALLSVSDEEKRLKLAHRAARLEWAAEDLEKEIKKVNERYRFDGEKSEAKKEPPELLKPKRGALYIYRVTEAESLHREAEPIFQIDLGFSSFRTADMKKPAGLKAGDIVESRVTDSGAFYLVKAADKTAVELFTFKAYVKRVVDADTLRVIVDLGFGFSTDQYLRLRGINCPEVATPEGRRAKQLVESELKDVPFVTITSTRSDKYDRYLADVWYTGKEGEIYLNNLLLERRLAERMDD